MQVGYRMFKTFNIEMKTAKDVLTNMCHLYEVNSQQKKQKLELCLKECQRRQERRSHCETALF